MHLISLGPSTQASTSGTFPCCAQHVCHVAKGCECILVAGKGLKKSCSACTVLRFPSSLMSPTGACSFTVISHESTHVVKYRKSWPQILQTLNTHLGSKTDWQINGLSKFIQTTDTSGTPCDMYVLVIGEKVPEEEDLDMNVLLFGSSLNICCWLYQRWSGGSAVSLV